MKRKTTYLFGLLVLSSFASGCNTASSPSRTAEVRPADSTSGSAHRSENNGKERRRQNRPRSVDSAAPGEFDFYLLNLSWSPEFCVTHPAGEECAAHRGFIVHGLWPQNTDGTYPEHCGSLPGPSNRAGLGDMMPVGLVAHEWETHGTCSGLNADEYFREVRKAFGEIKIPASLGRLKQEVLLSPETIVSQFASTNPGFPASSFALSCGNNRLTAIEVCLSKDLRPEPCEGVRSCRANVVRITPQFAAP